MAVIGRLQILETFEAKKAKFIGRLPGYDAGWLRNVRISFCEAPTSSPEYTISRWWLGISVQNETRIEVVPFQPSERKVTVENFQLQVMLQDNPKSEDRISTMKICDESSLEFLNGMKDFILTRICDAPHPLASSSSVRSQVTVGGNGGYDDKENMSSGQSTTSSGNSERQRAFAKQGISGSLSGTGTSGTGGSAAAVSKGVSGSAFYGKTGASSSSTFCPSPFVYRPEAAPKPTQSLSSLRPTSSTSPPNPVGSQGRPIPNFAVKPDSKLAASKSPGTPFTAYGAKLAKENSIPSSTRPIVNTYGRGSTGPYSTFRDSPSFSKTKPSNNYSQFDFKDENDENYNGYKEPRRSSSSPIETGNWRENNNVSPIGSTIVVRSRSSSPIGLLNLGNSCYMNAVLQALFAQPNFNYDLQRVNEDDFLQVTSELLREKELEKGQSSMEMVSGANQRNKNAEEASLILCMLKLLRSCSAIPADTIDHQKTRLLAVKTASKKFTDSQQHDAQEFLCCVLDDLKEEHRNCFTAMKNAIGDFSDEDETNRAEILVNPVTANFDFTLRKSLSCRECCKVANEQLESFNNLSVHIPNAEASVAALQSKQLQETKKPSTFSQILVNSSLTDDVELPDLPEFENANENVPPLGGNINTNKASTSAMGSDSEGVVVDISPSPAPVDLSLQDCIDHFFQKEEIEYRSEGCGHEKGGVVSYCLASFPRIFVIHLKRFLYTMSSNVGTKCTLPVTIPLELDLSKYCAQKGVQFPKLIDSPLAKETLRSQLLSPGKISPSSSPPHHRPVSKCRKRLLSDDDPVKNDSKCENDENVPISGPPKRSRSTTSEKINHSENGSGSAGVVPDSPHHESSNDGDSSSGRSCTNEFQQYTRYRLSAIISHTGSSSDYGHYTTDAYHSAQRKWFRFDDMAVKSVTEANVLEENKLNGYIFFYTSMPVFEQAVANAVVATPSNSNFNGKNS